MSVEANHPVSRYPSRNGMGASPPQMLVLCATNPNANNNRRSGLGYRVCS